MLNVFDSDAFGLVTMTARINELEFVPMRLGELGIFSEAGVPTTDISIEKDGDNLGLVVNRPRGSEPKQVDPTKRDVIRFPTLHLAERATVLAEEVQGVRAFGQESALQSVEAIRDQRLMQLQRRIEATQEWHRVGALKGVLTQPDGSTIIDLFDRFSLTQSVVGLKLDDTSTDVAERALTVLEAMESNLGAFPFITARAIMGSTIWRSLIEHAKVRETYLSHAPAAVLRGDRRDAFEFGGIIWERYRGTVDGNAYVGANEGYVFPEGVADLFQTRYAPADYMETVNTMGLPFYSKAEPMKFNRGVEIEAQSNPIHLCTRPTSVIKVVTGDTPT